MQRRRWGFPLVLVLVLVLGLVLIAGAVGARANTARDRTISLYNIHSKETLTIQYMGKQLID